MSLFDRQFEQLQADHPGVQVRQASNGFIVTVPGIRLEPAGAWNKAATAAHFVAPTGYPQAAPDCFWVDEDVRLRSGAMPMNTSMDSQLGPTLLWFSWHVGRWSPSKDTLKTYLRVIEARLRNPT